MILSELVDFYNELDFIQRIKLTKQLANIELDKITQLIVDQPAISQRMANDLLYFKNGIFVFCGFRVSTANERQAKNQYSVFKI